MEFESWIKFILSPAGKNNPDFFSCSKHKSQYIFLIMHSSRKKVKKKLIQDKFSENKS